MLQISAFFQIMFTKAAPFLLLLNFLPHLELSSSYYFSLNYSGRSEEREGQREEMKKEGQSYLLLKGFYVSSQTKYVKFYFSCCI